MTDQHIRPINTEDDYNSALARVEALMENDNRSADQTDELSVLATLIEVYEDRQFPMDAPDPVEAIKFRMEQLGKAQSDLAPILGSRAKVSEVLSGKRELTLKMIRALHQHLDIPAEILIQDSLGLPRKPKSIDADRLPLLEMAKRGWIEKAANLRDRAEEVLQEMIRAAGGEDALPKALFRQGGGARVNAKMDLHAMQAWCLYILGQARQMELKGTYEEGTIDQEFLRKVAALSVFDEGPKLAKDLLSQHGIALVVVRHLPKTYLDGAALWTKENVPVVGMTIRYDRIDNFWFCLLHELAHLGRHFGEVFIDDLQLRERSGDRDDEREAEADEWAQEALIPTAMWDGHPARLFPTVSNVLSLAKMANVHPAVVAGRVRHERNNFRMLSQFVGSKEVGRQLYANAS